MNQRPDLTFKRNRLAGRHGWLRLTPAYSVTLVGEILDSLGGRQSVIEPFSGSGTTAVVSCERGADCDAFDINPFLIWLAGAKARNYSSDEQTQVMAAARQIVESVPDLRRVQHWLPPIANIERWWSADRLRTLASVHAGIAARRAGPVADLLKIAFSRVMIDWSNVAFNHQSMSFKPSSDSGSSPDDERAILTDFVACADRLAVDIATPLTGAARFLEADSRTLTGGRAGAYTALITSPPYPNRMSYVRELRPYMYWLGFLSDGRGAGDLDWQAIGGTWGIATSRVAGWTAGGRFGPGHAIHATLARIAPHSELLANYVHKYFEDMAAHFDAVVPLLAPGARVFYVVGNSKFYDALVPVEELYADLMRHAGLRDVSIRTIRKRSSKKELYEYVVTGTRGGE